MSQSIGEKLRLAREAQGIALREISEQTRISMRYLEAIEGDDYKHLPVAYSIVVSFAPTPSSSGLMNIPRSKITRGLCASVASLMMMDQRSTNRWFTPKTPPRTVV